MGFLEKFREEMAKNHVDYMVLKDADPHQSEYVNEYFKYRTVLSGFTGSNGTLVVGINEAFLFTDGRYFIQAEKELSGTGITLMKMGEEGVPTVKKLLSGFLDEGKTVGCFPLIFSFKEYLNNGFNYSDDNNKIFLNAYKNSYGNDYPKPHINDALVYLPDELSGENIAKKIEKVREYMDNHDMDVYISSSLDSNMWLMNLRGMAIKYNPVALSYVVIEKEKCLFFKYSDKNTSSDKDLSKYSRAFIIDEKEIEKNLKDNGVTIKDYNEFEDYINALCDSAHKHNKVKTDCSTNKNTVVAFNQNTLSSRFALKLKDSGIEIKDDDCNVSLNKTIKNETEIKNIKEAYKKDNKVLTDHLNWIKKNDVVGMSEYEIGLMLDNKRLNEDDCFDLSFDTISAFGPNAAMMHYQSKENDTAIIESGNMYLVDSGGQWIGATTDVTRTVIVGKATYEMKHDYTKVVRGMLALQNATFIKGCTGINLDILAREPMWEEGEDYKCGTGHGVGYMLSVHEGSHAVRWRINPSGKDVVLQPGMLLSDEPGVYKEGKYGIRLENILLVKEKCKTEDGTFLNFECLTYVPLDENLILRDEMSEKELKLLDDYQKKCFEINN